MKQLFYPRSIVVVGVSENPQNMGRIVVEKLARAGFAEPVYAVGQRCGKLGDREILTSVMALPQPVDLAAILVPANSVPSTLEECGQMGIKWAIVMTAGFSEYADENRELEKAILSIANHYGMRLIGPNCIGILNTSNCLTAFFAPIPLQSLMRGPVSILAQSGSVVMEYTAMLSFHKVGVAKFVSLGNKLVTDEADLLKYLIEDDPDTKQILMYLEGIGDGLSLFQQAKRSTKPIVMLKANTVPGGNAAAKSHTASLASDDAVVDAMCRQANIVRARSMDQLLDYTKVLSLPAMRGNRIAMVTISGGAGVLATDYCHTHGFTLPPLPAPVIEDITERAHTKAVLRGNPLDLGDNFDSGLVLYAAETILRLPEIDALLLCPAFDPEMQRTGPSIEELVHKVGRLSLELQKPVLFSFSPYLASLDIIRERIDFPMFNRPEEAIEALAVSRDYWHRRSQATIPVPTLVVDRARVTQLINTVKAEGLTDVGTATTEILNAYGLSVEVPRIATTSEEAITIAQQMGYPVVMKIHSPDISHKSDVGGVVLNLRNDRAIRAAFTHITKQTRYHRPQATILGVTVQKMVAGGREVIIGSKRDAQFGPVVMFGLSGILVELLKDVSFRLAPLTRQDALDLIDEVKTSKLLRGFRGEEPSDVEAIVDALLRLSQLVTDFPEIGEVDINPLKVFKPGEGCRVIDARMFLS